MKSKEESFEPDVCGLLFCFCFAKAAAAAAAIQVFTQTSLLQVWICSRQ